MTNENENVIESGWYWYTTLYTSDEAFATPELAIDDAKKIIDDEAKIYVVHGEKHEIKISAYMTDIIQSINDNMDDYQDDDGDGPFYFPCSEDEESFENALRAAADQWQEQHKHKFFVYDYDPTTKREYVINAHASDEVQSC